MVDIFEEDFDSDDFYTRKLENIQPEVKKPEKIDIPRKKKESLASSVTTVDTPVNVDPLKTPTEQNLRNSIDFDSWLEGTSSLTVSKPLKNEFFESSEDETNNPLVTQVEDDEMETIKSTEGSTSAGSNLGFSVLPKKSPNDEALEGPKLKSKKKTEGKKKRSEAESTRKKRKSKKGENEFLVEDLQISYDKNVEREHYESL